MWSDYVRQFDNGVIASVYALGYGGLSGALKVDQNTGVINLGNIRPNGFHVSISVPDNGTFVVTMKNVSLAGGAYRDDNIKQVKAGRPRHTAYRTTSPIEVNWQGKRVFTRWHPKTKEGPDQMSNRIDVWNLEEDGDLRLLQVGVVTHDDGKTFHLLGERIWEGRLYKNINSDLVTVADHVRWGAFTDSRRHIFNHRGFNAVAKNTDLRTYGGEKTDFAHLDDLPAKNGSACDYARVLWYIVFAGQKGQGMVQLRNGSTMWFHGNEVDATPDSDGIVRFRCNDLFRYQSLRKNSDPKKPSFLVGIELISE